MHNKYCNSNAIVENLKTLSVREQSINMLVDSLINELFTFEITPLIKTKNSYSEIISELSQSIHMLSNELTTEHKVNICKKISDYCLKNHIDLWGFIH